MSVAVMKKLDEANTTAYENPSPHKVNVHIKKGPFIVVSGHDLKDLEMLLEQTNILTLLGILGVLGKINKKNLTIYQDVYL